MEKLKIFYSKYWPSLSTHFDHLSGNLWIPRQKNCCSLEPNHSDTQFSTSWLPAKCFDCILNRFCFVCRCIVMEQNYLAVSSGPFWSFFDQCMVQIDHLLSVAISINSFTRFQELMVHHTFLIPPDTQHCLLSEAIRFCS